MIRFVIPVLAAACLVMGCGRTNVGQLLTQCNELKDQNTEESWQQIRQKLSTVRANGRIPKDDPNAAAIHNLYVMSLLHTCNGDYAEAGKVAAEVLQSYPENFLANYHVGKIRLEQGAPAEAYPFLEKAVDLNRGNIPALTLLLNAAEQSGAPGADRHFEAASGLAEFSNDSKFYNTWGLWLSSQNRHLAAVQKFGRSVSIDDSAPKPYLNMAIVFDKHLENPRLARKYYLMYKDRLRQNPAMNTAENHLPVQARLVELSKSNASR